MIELVIAGQGTIALEMLAAHPGIDTLVIPIGGGGLISGIAIAAKALKPDIESSACRPSAFPSMLRALKGTTPAFGASTIAEGIAVKEAGQAHAAAIARSDVDDILLVDEGDIEQAIVLLLQIEKTVVEGAGAAGLAALLARPGALQRAQGRPRAVRRQYRHADARRDHPARHGALRAHGTDRIEVRDLPGSLAGSRVPRRAGRQHRRGPPPARLHSPAGAERRDRLRREDAQPRARAQLVEGLQAIGFKARVHNFEV